MGVLDHCQYNQRVCVALVQVTGEALYTDDVPLPANTLHAALVKSIRPHARINSVDPSAALQVSIPYRPFRICHALLHSISALSCEISGVDSPS